MLDRNILLASVLKPCDDTRMFEKMGMSLAQLPKVTVHIIGHKVNRKFITPNIIFHPIFSFSRTSIYRFLAPWKYAILLLKVKPSVVIVNTHELLIFTVVYKILFGAEIYYDIQENYFQNIAYTTTFPKGFRRILASMVRAKENLLSPFFNHFILAERCYLNEIPFIRKRPFTIVENKFLKESTNGFNIDMQNQVSQKIKNKDHLQFIYSGTIAVEYGIFEAVHFMKEWVKVYPNSHLYIIGFCPKASTWEKLQDEINGLSFIDIHSKANILVPHKEILQALCKADLALLPYLPLEYTRDRIPTKMYECMSLLLPMITQTNALWKSIIDPWEAGAFIDFSHVNIEHLLVNLSHATFYPKGTPTDIYWESEEQKLLQLFV